MKTDRLNKNSMRRFFLNDGTGSFIAAIITIILGLLVGLVLLLIIAPQQAGPAFKTLISGGFNSVGFIGGVSRMLYYAVPYIMCGLCFGFAQKTGVFNLGVVGQYIVGLCASIFVAILGHGIFGSLTWLAAIIAGAAAGAIWGLIQGALQISKDLNPIILGIMMNYIAVFLINLLMSSNKQIYVAGRGWTEQVPSDAIMPRAGFNHFLGNSTGANLGIYISIILCIVAFFLLKKTTTGYEMKATGFNIHAANYAGINVKKSIILAMIIAGAFAGLGGGMNHLAAAGTRYQVTDALPTAGFTGMSVAMIANGHPIGIIFSGLLISYLSVGGLSMQAYGLQPETVDVITSIIIYFCAFNFVFRELYFKFINKVFGEEEL